MNKNNKGCSTKGLGLKKGVTDTLVPFNDLERLENKGVDILPHCHGGSQCLVGCSRPNVVRELKGTKERAENEGRGGKG